MESPYLLAIFDADAADFFLWLLDKPHVQKHVVLGRQSFISHPTKSDQRQLSDKIMFPHIWQLALCVS
jgi:hypothetical protein